MTIPRDVDAYLSSVLRDVPWDDLKALRPDLCANCPEHARAGVSAPDYPLSPVCMSCPWFGYVYGEMCAENWQSPRRPRRPKHKAE